MNIDKSESVLLRQAGIYQNFDFAGGDAVIDQIYNFAMKLRWDDVPDVARQRTKNLFMDLSGVLAVGTETPVSHIIRDMAVEQFGPSATSSARLPLDGRAVSPSGAAMATGMTIDSIDAHDGHNVARGHVGCGLLATLLAVSDDLGITDGKELLTTLLIGYEIGTAAAYAIKCAPETAMHFSSSGSWVSLGCAAMAARLMQLDRDQFHHAMAIAEYHGPRSWVMKVANHPTMLKDGSGWGAMTGVSAAYMARAGFTGAPVILIESTHLQQYWGKLGSEWEVLQQYVKPQPVCRWTQQSTQAVASLLQDHEIDSRNIVSVIVDTFEEATLLSQEPPTTTEQAQYNVRFPLAVLLARGKLGAREVTDQTIFEDPEVLRLFHLIELRRKPEFDAVFPLERWAIVRIEFETGDSIESSPAKARGESDTMLSDVEFQEKFRDLTSIRFSPEQATSVLTAIEAMDTDEMAWSHYRKYFE